MNIKNTSTPLPTRAWAVFWCVSIFYFYELVLRMTPSVMTSDLMAAFKVNSTELGVLSSFYYYGYTPLQIPCGILVDRMGVRMTVVISCLLCVTGGLLFGMAESLALAQLGRFLIGAGSACAFISTLKVVADWFPTSYFVVLTGVANAMGTLGGTFGGSPLAIMVDNFGWRDSMTYLSLAGILVTLAAYFVIKDHPESSGKKQDRSTTNEIGILDSLKRLATSKQTWLISIFGCLTYLPISAFCELWAVPYISTVFHVETSLAAFGGTMIFLGMAFGGIAFAWFSDKIQSRKKAMMLAALLTALMFLALIFIPGLELWHALVILLIAGFMSGGEILSFAGTKEINPIEISGTTLGFTNMVIMLGGIIFQPLLGKLIDLSWDGATDTNMVPIYSESAYQNAILAVPVCLCLAFIIASTLRESFPKAGRVNK